MSEHTEQEAVFIWASMMEAQYPELRLLYAIPNGAKLPRRKNKSGQWYSPEGVKLKAEGMRPGMPDMALAVPRQGWHGLFIEMKNGYKNKPKPHQVSLLDALSGQGYLATVCHSTAEAIETISDYLEIKL